MADRLKRRTFIKSISLAGASLAIADAVPGATFPAGDDVKEIKNKWFTVSFDRQKGRINILKNDGTALILGATSCVNLPGEKNVSLDKRSISTPGYKHTAQSFAFNDANGTGKNLVISSKDPERKLDFEIRLSLYDNLQAITIETICKNVSRNNLTIHSIEPLRVIKAEGGQLKAPGVSKCITNGEMYFDAGMIHAFGNDKDAITSGKLKGVTLANGPISPGSETIHSW